MGFPDDRILQLTEQKEEKMEDTVSKEAIVAMWRQELELTYGNQITELQNKLAAAEATVESYRNTANSLQSQVNQIIDNLTEDYWYSDSTDKDEVLSELCDIIGHNPTKEICFTATIRFNGRIDVPLSDVGEFSISDALSDAYVDVNNGDIVIDDYDIEEVSEEY